MISSMTDCLVSSVGSTQLLGRLAESVVVGVVEGSDGSFGNMVICG